MDSKILKASILNGAIELLPETLSTLAIIPLQMRLVYQIGQSYGYQLDSGHIKDFLATLGVGLTSQYLEQAGRKLLGGLLGKVGGGLLGGLGKQAVSSGMSFASTYALGHVANQYYAGDRTLSTRHAQRRLPARDARRAPVAGALSAADAGNRAGAEHRENFEHGAWRLNPACASETPRAAWCSPWCWWRCKVQSATLGIKYGCGACWVSAGSYETCVLPKSASGAIPPRHWQVGACVQPRCARRR